MGCEFSWEDFAAFVHYLPRDSQLAIAISGPPPWGVLEQLMALSVDAVRAGNWQRGGGKGPKPKPVPVPGSKAAGKKYGTGTDMESVRVYLERVNGRAPEVR